MSTTATCNAARSVNEIAAAALDALTVAVTDAQARDGKASDALFDAWMSAARVVGESVSAVLATEPNHGDVVHTADGPLTVARYSDTGVVLTADGRIAIQEWHDAAQPTAEMVRYETWGVSIVDGTTFERDNHGYVDAQSRRIVQTG